MRRKKNKIPKLNIKKGDLVKVLSGNDKGTTGEVQKVFPKDRKAIVEGIRIQTIHTKPSAQNPDGGIVKKEAPIDVSNLMVVDPKNDTPTRIGRKKDSKGNWVRYSKKSGEVIK